MQKSPGWNFIIIFFIVSIFKGLNSSVTVANESFHDKDDILNLKHEARKLLKKPKPLKKAKKSPDHLITNFFFPDYSKRVKRHPFIRKMKDLQVKFNMNPDSDEAMEDFGEPGTFVWLQGRQPTFIYGPDCFSRIIRENKEEDQMTHLGFFGKFLKHLRRRFMMNRRRRVHSLNSKMVLRNRIRLSKRNLAENKEKLKARILQSNFKKIKKTSKIKRRDAILDFLHLKPKRKLSGIPAQAKATIDDSYIHITSFARPPLQQSSLVRSPSDNSTNVIQMTMKLPNKFLKSKKGKSL